MVLTHGVYFYPLKDSVYLRNVNNQRDYMFNATACDILEYIRSHPGCSETDICLYMLELYQIADPSELERDIRLFVEELSGSGIVVPDDDTAGILEDNINNRVDELCQRHGILHSVSLELTYRCSERCIHCYVDDGCRCNPEPELTMEEYKDILHQLREMGCINLLLTGGEVCLHKHFIEIARYAVSQGFLVDVYTNGISMTDEQFDELCEMKVNSVSFSLYSGVPEIHDAITKVPGSFERTVKRMMMFKCAGVDTYIKTVVIQQNLDSLHTLFELGKRLRIEVAPATSISDTHSGQSANTCRLQTQEQRIKAIHLIRTYNPSSGPSGERDLDGTVCNAATTGLSVDPYGGVHPCLAFPEPVGSVRESTIREIWENAPLMRQIRSLRFRELSADCSSCACAGKCAVCLGAAYVESGGKLCPSSDTCQWTQAKYEADDPASI